MKELENLFGRIKSASTMRQEAGAASERFEAAVLRDVLTAIEAVNVMAGEAVVPRMTPAIQAHLEEKGHKVYTRKAGPNEEEIVVRWGANETRD